MKKEFGIEHIPRYYWLLSLLKLVKPESLNKCLMKWAVQQLIGELDIQDCMVAADALNCQRETAEAIVRGKGDYLLDAKGNQPI